MLRTISRRQLFPLIVMTFHTTIDAGRLGMTLSITTAIQMFSQSWVQTKYSVAAQHHARGARELAGTMWRHAAVVSSIVLVFGFAVLAALIPATAWIRPDLPSRFIEPSQVLWLGLGALGVSWGLAAVLLRTLARWTSFADRLAGWHVVGRRRCVGFWLTVFNQWCRDCIRHTRAFDCVAGSHRRVLALSEGRSMSDTGFDMESTACPLCGQEASSHVMTGRDLLFFCPGEFSIVRCKDCSHAYLNPRPTLADIGTFYPDDYGPHADEANEPKSDPQRS